MRSFLKAALMFIFMFFGTVTQPISFSGGLESLKNRFNKIYSYFWTHENYKTKSYKIDDLIDTVPYKLYLVIEELKQPANDLLLNRLLLHGPPGNGKSTYVRKIATMINATLLEIGAPSLVTTYQGSGAENINKAFDAAIEEQANSGGKVIIFIDEIDAIASIEIKQNENKASAQALWLQLDKIKKNPNIFVFASTNEFKSINPTLLDRFGDNIVKIPNPDNKIREEVIHFYSKKFNLDESAINVATLVQETKGFSIRAIEDMLRSIKKISNQENNGVPTPEIISTILDSHKQKVPLISNYYSKTDVADNLNKISSFVSIVANVIAIYRNMWPESVRMPTFPVADQLLTSNTDNKINSLCNNA